MTPAGIQRHVARASRRGIVLLEVLVASAILAAVVVALLSLQEGSLAREQASAGLLAASAEAERLMAEVDMQARIVPGLERGPVGGLPGGAYRREVSPAGDLTEGNLFHVQVEVTYDVAGLARTFELGKWILRKREQSGSP